MCSTRPANGSRPGPVARVNCSTKAFSVGSSGSSGGEMASGDLCVLARSSSIAYDDRGSQTRANRVRTTVGYFSGIPRIIRTRSEPMPTSPREVPGQQIAFDAFRLDIGRHRIWRGDQEIALRPKAWDVLCYLLERPGLLVTKEVLHRAVWPGTAVTDDTLTKVIAELRQALQDDPRAPRVIETVHARGFRLVVTVQGLGPETGGPTAGTDAAAPTAASPRGMVAPVFVGRQPELTRLDECLGLAAEGARQLVFITGEAGIGKTTLVEA